MILMKSMCIATFGSVVTFLGTMAFIGHILNYPSLYWWKNEEIGMALNTSICFILTGITLIIIALKNGKQ